MRHLVFIWAILAYASGGLALAAECTRPGQSPSVPDGATALPEQMRSAMSEVKTYDLAMTAYTRCLQDEYLEVIATTNPSEQRKIDLRNIQIMKHNEAIDEAEAVVAMFNEQLRLFKAARQPTQPSGNGDQTQSTAVLSDAGQGSVLEPAQEPAALQAPQKATLSLNPPPTVEVATSAPPTATAGTAGERLAWEPAKAKCQQLGFAPNTEDFGQCVLQLTR